MNENQVFLLFFLQNVLNFLFFYFFTEKYSQMFKDLNVQFQNTTQMFLDHLSDMYYYGYNNVSYTDEDEDEYEDEDEDEEGGDNDNDKEDEDDKEEDEEEVEDVKEKEQNLFQSG